MLAATVLTFACLFGLSTAYPETRLWFNTSGNAFTFAQFVNCSRLVSY